MSQRSCSTKLSNVETFEDKPSDLARLKRSGPVLPHWNDLNILSHVSHPSQFQSHLLSKECHTFCNGCLLLGLHKELGVATAPIAYDFMPWNHLCIPSEFPGNSNISELLLEDLNFLRIALSAAASPGNAALEMLRGLLSQTVTWHYTRGSLSCTNMQTAVIPGRTEIIEVVPSESIRLCFPCFWYWVMFVSVTSKCCVPYRFYSQCDKMRRSHTNET